MRDPNRDSGPDLLGAYLDGVGELQPGERREVEGWLKGSDDAAAEAEATRDLIGKLRAMPLMADDGEPSWTALERSIRDAIDAQPVPRRAWWRRTAARWAMPIVAFTMATAVLLLWNRQADAPRPVASTDSGHARSSMTSAVMAMATPPAHPAAPVVRPRPAPSDDDSTAVWLDGDAVDLDGIADPTAVIDALDHDLFSDPMAAADPSIGTLGDGEAGLLPSTDLGWIDDLDTTSINRLDGWLKRTKG